MMRRLVIVTAVTVLAFGFNRTDPTPADIPSSTTTTIVERTLNLNAHDALQEDLVNGTFVDD